MTNHQYMYFNGTKNNKLSLAYQTSRELIESNHCQTLYNVFQQKSRLCVSKHWNKTKPIFSIMNYFSKMNWFWKRTKSIWITNWTTVVCQSPSHGITNSQESRHAVGVACRGLSRGGGTSRQNGIQLGKSWLELSVRTAVLTTMTETDDGHILLLGELLTAVDDHLHYLLHGTHQQTYTQSHI